MKIRKSTLMWLLLFIVFAGGSILTGFLTYLFL